jgi:hypothetical protein
MLKELMQDFMQDEFGKIATPQELGQEHYNKNRIS